MSTDARRILVTGGCGFIASNLVHYLLEKHPEWHIHNLDALTYAAQPEHLADLEDDPRYTFREGDIADVATVQDVFASFRPDGVFHLAAETHVDNSIRDPEPFLRSNFLGTFNLLQSAKEAWGDDQSKRFLHVSTDEVYGSLGPEGAFTEEMPYKPNNPYSAMKAGSDHLVRAWQHTYNLNAVTTNCSNNFGPCQHREKLIPTVIRTAMAHKPIPVYGDGSNVRDWLYVEDHCSALDAVFHRGVAGETYAVGTRNEWKNIDLVRLICTSLDDLVGEGPEGSYSNLITFVTDRPGHDKRYAIDPTKIETVLGWHAAKSFEQGMRETVAWYIELFRDEQVTS